MVTQLIQHERIQTTVAKAKELRKVADRVVTYAKKVSTQQLSPHRALQTCRTSAGPPASVVLDGSGGHL